MFEFFKNKRVLVTGGAGFVGTNLIKKLIPTGAILTATYNNNKPKIIDKNINYIKSDLRVSNECRKVAKNIDYIFMCAANTSGAKVMTTTPLVHLTPNILMNLNMLEAAYELGAKKFLFISSNTVYPLTDNAVKEGDVTNEFYESYHIVAWMKRFTEIVCHMYSNHLKEPMKTVVVRPANLYGPYDKFDWEKSKVIPAIIRRAIERHDPFQIWGDGMDLKDFLYIDDCIEGLLLAMEKLDEFEPMNIASGIPVTIREVLEKILKAADYEDADIQYDKSKPTMIPKRMMNISLATEKLGFKPKTSLEDGIKNTIDWYRKTYTDNSQNDKL